MQNIRKIVRQTLQEYITPGELKNVEKFADNLFSNIGVDVEFTRHFLDRVNDLRNKVDITPEELRDLYLKTYKRYNELIPALKPGEERVITDPKTNINVPFVMSWDGRSPEMDLVNKTIMRKKDFKSYTPKLTLEIIEEAIGRIKKIKLNGTYYHGTSIQEDDNLFNEFNPQYSDWEATWFSNDESIAIDFADSAHREENEIQAIYKVTLKCAPIADINYEQSTEMMKLWALSDFRESIPILVGKGFRGWKTPGSIGSTLYDDIAIFSPHCIDVIQGVKLFIDGDWTEYMSLNDAQQIINKKRASVAENIDVPINVGDTVLGGKFKNKKIVVKDIDKNEKGDITINDKPLLRVRTINNKKNMEQNESKGLWANIHAKKQRGESPAKPGDEDYPKKDAWEKNTESSKNENHEYTEDNEQEGSDYKIKLLNIKIMSEDIYELLDEDDELPSWVQDKITIAEHNMDAILGYLISKNPEAFEDSSEDDDLDDEDLEEACNYLKKSNKFKSKDGNFELYEVDESHYSNLNEAEYQGRKVKLGKIMKGDVKKSKVYVKKPNGKIVKVNFGDPNMRIKKNIPARRKSFRARMKCDNPGPRWKARYWACRTW